MVTVTLDQSPWVSIVGTTLFFTLATVLVVFMILRRMVTSSRLGVLAGAVLVGGIVGSLFFHRLDAQIAVRVSDENVTISYFRKPGVTFALKDVLSVEEVYHREMVLRLVVTDSRVFDITAPSNKRAVIAQEIAARAHLQKVGESTWRRP